jgi:DEAD/DEAH box helicase domain-containing protein
VLEAFLEWLRESANFQWTLVHHEILSQQPPVLEALPPGLHPTTADLIQRSLVKSLYSHQAEAARLALEGNNVVLSTSTASGKTLAYQIPVLDRLVREPASRALFLFPLKALERDQKDAFLSLAAEAGLTAAVYDGDTPAAERRKIKSQPPRVLITNPDMLHVGLLAYHDSWKELFSNLEYVVLDEVHTYKGIFGSHISQVLLRTLRVCSLYGSHPRFIACSATVSNPGTFVSKLIGQDVAVVNQSGAPCPERHFLFVNPILSPYTVAARLFTRALNVGLKTICFTRARKITELITTWVLAESPRLRDRISSYRAGFLPEERREIERRLFSGRMDGVISTSALEMGIDVGGLDLCLLVGYPGTIINTWQRGGRVGRSNRPSGIVLIAGSDALDQYFLRNPDDFFSRRCEEAILDPLNTEVLKRHVPCAAAEAPISSAEEWTQSPEVQEVVAELEEAGTLYRSADGLWHSTARRPQREVDLRGIGASYAIFLEDGKTLIGSSSGGRVFSECHEGAIYLHRTKQYVVTKLDLERHNAFVRPASAGYYTRALADKETEILGAPIRFREFPGFIVREGRLKVTEQVTAYEKRRTQGQDLVGVVELDLPLLHFETVGIWIEIPDGVQNAVEAAELHFMGGIHAMEHAAISMFPLFALCDRDDIGGISTPEHPQVCKAAVFIYDGHPGGVGLAHRAFEVIEELLEKTRLLVEKCPCEDGCPSCIHSPKCGSGNKPLDKQACVMVLDLLLNPGKMAELTARALLSKKEHAAAKVEQKKSPRTLLYERKKVELGDANSFSKGGRGDFPVDNHGISTASTTKKVSKTASQPAGLPIRKVVREGNSDHLIFPDLVPPRTERAVVGVGAGSPKKSRTQGAWTMPDNQSTLGEIHPLVAAEQELSQAALPLAAKSKKRIVVFDLETQKLAQEVGGWRNVSKMGLSLAVTHTDAEGFQTFTEDTVSQLIDLLKGADLVVGFNQMRFDYEVLVAYTSENLRALPNLDILAHIESSLGFRLSLNHVALFTLGQQKSGEGTDAVKWFREKKMDLLERYCRDDVALTRDLYTFGLEKGFLRYKRKSGKLGKIQVAWAE